MYIKTSRVKLGGKIYEYKRLVQGIRVGSKIKHKVIAYLGSMEDPSSAASFLFSQSPLSGKNQIAKLYALPVAINMIIEKLICLPSILSEVLPDKLSINVSLLTKLMIMGRILNPDSKLSLTRWYHHLYLPEKLPKTIDVHHFYYTLDHLITHKEAIEKKLYRILSEKQLIDAAIVFYDLTSSYFEGEEVEMAKYGYSRDHRPDLLQITLGLVIDRKNGLPIYHEVFEGNMSDSKTVKGILEKLKKMFSLQEIIFVADKGMLSPDNLKGLKERQYKSILSESARSALSQQQREELFLQKDTFSKLKDMEDSLWYKETKNKEGEDVILCYNQHTAFKAKQTRDEKLEKIQKLIREIKDKEAKKEPKKAGTDAKMIDKKTIQKMRDAILAKLIKSHARKYFDTAEKETVEELFQIKENVIKREEYMDGMWAIRSTTENLTTEQTIRTYKDLKTIEASFRIIKDVIELRPIYHHKNDRVKGHVFICILAFLVTRLLEQKTDSTIKMLKEDYMTSVIINGKTPTEPQQIIGGETLLKKISLKV